MDKLAASIDKASQSADQQDSKVQRAGQSFASVRPSLRRHGERGRTCVIEQRDAMRTLLAG
ncbi:MAG TPA: hypothetical protein VIJ55_11525 [Acetobacteraceae bacterium]